MLTKNEEKRLIQSCAESLGYEISNENWREKPDAIVTLSINGDQKRTAIELTEYVNDAKAGEMSPLTRLAEFWVAVQERLSALVEREHCLAKITASVRLKPAEAGSTYSHCRAGELADELVRFAGKHLPSGSRGELWWPKDFSGCPEMQLHVEKVRFSRSEIADVKHDWLCENCYAAFVNLNMDNVKSTVRRKNDKARRHYKWCDAEEKWLLITAMGLPVNKNIGPVIDESKFNDPDLQKLCEESPFDRILLWDSARGSYKWLKPDEPVVERRLED